FAFNRRWPRTIIANSLKAHREALSDRGRCRPRQVLFVPNGIDLSLYQPRIHRNYPKLRLIGVGNLVPEKRWDRLLTAVASVRKLNCGVDFEVAIVGAGQDKQALTELSTKLGIDETVFMDRR